MSNVKITSVAAVLLCAGGVHAQTVIWDEATHGDLGELYQYSTPQPDDSIINLGALGFGASRIQGTNIQTSGSSNRFEGDAVRFTVPTGFSITQIIFEHNQTVGLREFLRMSGSSVVETYVFRNFPATGLSSPNYGVWVTHELVSQFVPGGGPLGPGEYILSWDNATFNTTMQYRMDFVVVPAPGAALVGLISAGVVTRRRRRGS